MRHFRLGSKVRRQNTHSLTQEALSLSAISPYNKSSMLHNSGGGANPLLLAIYGQLNVNINSRKIAQTSVHNSLVGIGSSRLFFCTTAQ